MSNFWMVRLWKPN